MSEDISIGSELQSLRDADPFQPFVIVMSSGARYRVEDAREIMFGRDSIVVVPLRRQTHSTLRLNHVSSIDLMEPGADQQQSSDH